MFKFPPSLKQPKRILNYSLIGVTFRRADTKTINGPRKYLKGKNALKDLLLKVSKSYSVVIDTFRLPFEWAIASFTAASVDNVIASHFLSSSVGRLLVCCWMRLENSCLALERSDWCPSSSSPT